MATAVVSNDINGSIIWLDIAVNSTQENINAQQMLQTPTFHLKTFTDDSLCENYIQSLSQKHRIILIAGGRLGQLIIPRIHQLTQISAIFFYCTNSQNEQWTRNYEKIIGVIDDMNELILQVLSTIEKPLNRTRLQSTLPITIFNPSISSIEQSSTELNGQFVHSQILIDCLLRMKSLSTDKIESLTIIDYSSDQALTWYTRDCFLYRLLNKALRTQDVDLLYLFGFFIRDLNEQLKNNQFQSLTQVYRGQLMSKKEIEQLKNSVGHLISMNSFLSTTIDRQVAIIFSGDIIDKDNQAVLFEIEADPRINGIKPFADITRFSYINDEQEILMMLGSIFRLTKFRYEGHLCIVQLVLCSENGHDIKPLFDQMKLEYHGKSHTHAGVYGIVLGNMGKFDDAKKYMQRELTESPKTDQHHTVKEFNQSVYYKNVGILACGKGDYKSSLESLQKALEIRMKLLKPNAPKIADVYHDIGNTYLKKGDYEQAMESFNKALSINIQAFGEDHPHVANNISNIGIVYTKKGQYSEALHYQLNALSIRQKHLPANHQLLGESHTHIAFSYRCLNELDLALEHYNTAREIHEKCLPADHLDVAIVYNGLGTVYTDKGNYHQALPCFEKAAGTFRATLPSDHPDVIAIQRIIDEIRNVIRQYK